MNKYEMTMMELAVPVINYLENNFPQEHFTACISHDKRNSDISTTVTVKEEIEGKDNVDICSFTNSGIYSLNCNPINKKLLSYSKLMELVKSTGIDEDTLFSMKLCENLPKNHSLINSH